MQIPPTQTPAESVLTSKPLAVQREAERRQKTIIVSIIAGIVMILAALIALIYFLLRPETPAQVVERLRDFFIIVVGLESLVIGVALIVLILQLANLINLLQNEVRPILHATSETVNTLRGTAEFMGENVVQPVIELKGYLAGLNRMLELLRIKRK
jgi:formate-dependent nitrite reductase membrane component NrfD